MEFRIEKDTMGEVHVPASKYWGAQTERSRNNFKIGPEGSMPKEIIYAFAYLKKAAAFANHELGVLAIEKRDLIGAVCDEMLTGMHDGEFPLVIWQTGSGTQSNMNCNEVIANRGHVLTGGSLLDETKALNPNDDVNKSQSSNDTYPTAMHIAAYKQTVEITLPGMKHLRDVLDQKAIAFKDIVKTGRTHFMDATPLTLGQEFSGYVAQIDYSIRCINNALEAVSELALGGTAVGTGLNTPAGYDVLVAKKIAEFTGLPFVTAKNKFEALAAHDALVETHGALKQVAVSLNKIANDIRWMGSGPVSGLGELKIPALQPGSSIMPGKVNPVIPEMMMQVSAQVIGNDSTITFSSANGNFELNTMLPVMAHNILESISILTTGTKTFTEKLIVGLEANTEKLNENIQKNSILVTALVPKLGYDTAAEIAKEAVATNSTIKKVLLEKALLSEDEIDNLLDIEKLI